jgi:8-oxo-dGTP pyrophosphatase MutT (NUDIX family)
MGRIEYYYDAHAPQANSLIPASNLLVTVEAGAILLLRRRDTVQWALPGGAQDIGETAAQCAVRECLEETGILAEITGFLGVYTSPRHIVAYSDGEIRQQYETTYIGRPASGQPAVNDEADAVRFVSPGDLGDYDIHPSIAAANRRLPRWHLPAPALIRQGCSPGYALRMPAGSGPRDLTHAQHDRKGQGDGGGRSEKDAVGGAEENLLELARQGAAPRQARRGGQGRSLDAGADHSGTGEDGDLLESRCPFGRVTQARRSDGPAPPISTMPGDAEARPGTVMVALSRTPAPENSTSSVSTQPASHPDRADNRLGVRHAHPLIAAASVSTPGRGMRDGAVMLCAGPANGRWCAHGCCRAAPGGGRGSGRLVRADA